MFEKRLITALLDQIAVLATAVEALSNDARRYNRGHEIEELLRQATSSMLRSCSSLSELERMITTEPVSQIGDSRDSAGI